jgi:TM2 domain-containing membrane protein YozV
MFRIVHRVVNQRGLLQDHNLIILKQKVVSLQVFLHLFVGYLGIHNFYLGHTGKGIVQLLLTTVGWILFFTGPMIAGLWSFIEALQLFLGSKNVDAKGIRLKD